MWRPTIQIFRKTIFSSHKENKSLALLYSTKKWVPKSTAKITLISAGLGVLAGVGYGGYTHYKVNNKSSQSVPDQNQAFAFLKQAPQYKSHYKVINDKDNSNLHLVLFQYRTCPFCCKVRAYLDAKGFSYEVVEVDAVLRQAIKWSNYKKVPILLAKVGGGYQQLLDSTAIISILETYLIDKSLELPEVIKFYPINQYVKEGKNVSDVTNKYFIMHNTSVPDKKERTREAEEREWRQWADNVLVHTLSPNVYRTPSEALETFKWFEEAGEWKQSFPTWECALMVYAGAAAMWIIAKRLKKRHNITGDARECLYDAANAWIKALAGKGTRFHGGDQPNLADISVYGILSSIEGCQAFKDLRAHTTISRWYDDIKSVLEKKEGKVIVAHA